MKNVPEMTQKSYGWDLSTCPCLPSFLPPSPPHSKYRNKSLPLGAGSSGPIGKSFSAVNNVKVLSAVTKGNTGAVEAQRRSLRLAVGEGQAEPSTPRERGTPHNEVTRCRCTRAE